MVEHGLCLFSASASFGQKNHGAAKAHSGGRRADSVALPRLPAPKRLMLHEVDLNEATGFVVEEHDQDQALGPLDLGWVVIEPSAHHVALRFASPSNQSGEPRLRARYAFILECGQWGRVATSCRHADDAAGGVSK